MIMIVRNLQVWCVLVVQPHQTLPTHPAHTVSTGSLLRACHGLLQQGGDELFSTIKQVKPPSPPSSPPVSGPVGVLRTGWKLIILVKVTLVVQPELGLTFISQNRLNQQHQQQGGWKLVKIFLPCSGKIATKSSK